MVSVAVQSYVDYNVVQGCGTYFAPQAAFSLHRGPEGRTKFKKYFLAVKMCLVFGFFGAPLLLLASWTK